jgi:hypothetical protein
LDCKLVITERQAILHQIKIISATKLTATKSLRAAQAP